MARFPALFATLVPPLVLAACAAPGPYPSLAPRPAETIYAGGDEERQPAALPDDPELAAQVERLVAAARSGTADFDAALPAAQSAVAAAGAAGSDSWVEAQQAVSRLEAARARTTSALADLDALAVARANAGTLGAGDRERLRATTAELQALADAQVARLHALQERLSRS